MRTALLLALAATACTSSGDKIALDASGADASHHGSDGGGSGSGSGGGSGSGAGAYRHTILVDGTNDFASGEAFPTTSAPSFTAYLAWDDTSVYVGYDGPDLATTTSDADSKWLFAYIDVDPGGATGATSAELYNTQAAAFPTGFGAEYYVRWKCDGTFSSVQHYDGTAWTMDATTPATGHAGQFIELGFPRALLTGNTAGITTYMINEKQLHESTFAGLYADDFTDGYATATPIAHYLKADFTSTRPPNDVANRAP